MRIKDRTNVKKQKSAWSLGKKLLKWSACTAAIAAVLALALYQLLSDKLEVTFHHLYSPKAVGAVNTRIVVLSDLHNREFGNENADLIAQIDALEPDLIAIAGDMITMGDDNLDTALKLCENLTQLAPVYYCLGNHEAGIVYNTDTHFDESLREMGVHLLLNQAEEVVVNKTPFLIGGLGTPQTYETSGQSFMEEFEKSPAFKLLLCHWPSVYEETLAEAEIDLGICGHYHGGQVRLPWIGGLYHGDTGFFPKYSGGMYELSHSTLFVSRGMGSHDKVPRVNNRPELAVIDVNGRREANAS